MKLHIATFEADVSAKVGHYLLGGLGPIAIKLGDPLKARGIILDDGRRRIVLCALDYCELGGRYHHEFRNQIAQAVNTTPDLVMVQTVHQHDAPLLREGMMKVMRDAGLDLCEEKWWQNILKNLATSASKAVREFQPVASIGAGQTKVTRMASNRRLVDSDGKVWASRMSVTHDREIRSAPEGLIDPMLKTLSFYGENGKLLATMSHYATHPQCSSGRGIISADAPGVALGIINKRYPGACHLYFTGCAGDVTLGKYSTIDRPRNARVIGNRLGSAIIRSIRDSSQHRSADLSLGWKQVPFSIPIRWRRPDPDWKVQIENKNLPVHERVLAALKLGAWEDRRHLLNQEITVLSLGSRRVVYLPGEVFVEYQLSVQKRHRGQFITFAALGECSMGYIPTAIAFEQGGYEPHDSSSYTTPAIEKKIRKNLEKALN